MGFNKNSSFNEPIFQASSVEVKKLIIIAFEGAETEHKYFSYLKTHPEINLKSLVQIELLERDEKNKNSSAPTKVVETVTNVIESEEKLNEIKSKHDEFDDSYDVFWIVIDREKQESKKINLLKAIEICKENNIKISLINPAFEFWLLLHFDISEYDNNDLFENKKTKPKSKKRFLEKEVGKKIGSYDKSDFETSFITSESVTLAVKQEEKFENELEKIIDNLGSNVGNLIKEILDIHI